MQAGLRVRQIWSWAVLAIFIAGWFWDPVGAWTGPIMGVWFVGTQKLRSGFLWLLAITLVPSVIRHWKFFFANHGEGAALLLLAAILVVLPLFIHRIFSERLSGIAWTLPYPLATLAIAWAAGALMQAPNLARVSVGMVAPHELTATVALRTFLAAWLASAIVWLWDRQFHLQGLFRIFAAGTKPWSQRVQTVAMLRSPQTHAPLRIVQDSRGQHLESSAGETFPIRDTMPAFLRPQDLTGQNRKYNRLYETIGGFYDDSQRVICALGGMDRDAYVMGYMELLEVKTGDRVLETSVGTGLNFKYLPRQIHRFGIDLSREMLLRCQSNLRRWNLPADLFLGNAEALPFADESFDVVFHVGGINFFSDRAAAIGEMIRVAKPGSLLLIADETEEHVKAAYENIPYTREFYKDRESAVTVPIDLVPDSMEEVQVKTLKIAGKNRFYALTFRKPQPTPSNSNPIAARRSELSCL